MKGNCIVVAGFPQSVFMPELSAAITHVSDTALLVAGCRAVESARPDALVRDPFASRLAGDRGVAMFHALPHQEVMGFGIAIRTRFIDDLVLHTVDHAGIKAVLSLGAGLDTRPWRLDLPGDLRWIEVDFPAMLDFKESALAGETPRCRRERLAIDLNDAGQRRSVYSAVAELPALMITEGLLLYLPASTVTALAAETSHQSSVSHWISDIITTSFSQAIGGGGAKTVQHVQASDHLDGEQILTTVYANGWRTLTRRSYITDLGFASERIKNMMAKNPNPNAKPPTFQLDDPAGVHLFVRA